MTTTTHQQGEISPEHQAIIDAQVRDWRKETARLQDLIAHATGGYQQGESVGLDHMTTDEAREYLVEFTLEHFADKTFHRYIRNDQGNRQGLAGDFAWQMARALKTIAQARASQPSAASDAQPGADERALFEAWYAPIFKGSEPVNMGKRRNGEYASPQDQIAWMSWRAALATPTATSSGQAGATVAAEPVVIALGQGLIEIGQGHHGEDRLPAILFGRNGAGAVGIETEGDRFMQPGECIAAITFDNPQSLDVVAEKLGELRARIWPDEAHSQLSYSVAPHFRGYAHLGIGAYVLNHSAAGEAPELAISIATEEQKAARTVGDLRDNAPGELVQPDDIAVRLRFENVAGLDALEQQLRFVRSVHFPDAAPASPATQQAAMDALALAYGYLWHVNANADAPPGVVLFSLTPERAAYEARKVLRDLLTNKQRGEGIGTARETLAAMSASVSEADGSGKGGAA